jgi:hypothetical protein
LLKFDWKKPPLQQSWAGLCRSILKSKGINKHFMMQNR